MHPLKSASLVFVFALVLFSWRIGEAPLAGTEGHRAIVAHQMVASGEWLVPRLYGVVYLRKPPMIYWLQAAAESAAGTPAEWVWRMPSALAAAGTAAWIAWLAGAWFGRRAALFAGVAAVSLVAMWSQNRSADMDAVNSLLALVTAGLLLDAWYRPGGAGGGWRWPVAALVFGSALLTKGPACLPVVLGAVLGASFLNRDRLWRNGRTWGTLGAGVLLFLAWVVLVRRRLGEWGAPVDDSGVEEALQRMVFGDVKNLLEAVSLPLQLAAMAMPASWALFLMWKPSRGVGEDARRVRAVFGAVFGAMAIGVASGMTNPRYGYGMLPWFALLAGAWFAGQASWGRPRDRRIGMAAIGMLSLAGVVLAGIALHKHGRPALDVTAAGLTALGLGGWGIRSWRSGATIRPLHGWITAGLVASMAVSFAVLKNAERTERSGLRAGLELRQRVGDGTTVHAAHMIMTHPELFYYSGLPIERYLFRQQLKMQGEVPAGWNVFLNREWAELAEGDLAGFSMITGLPTHVRGTVLAWYTLDSDRED